MVNLDDQFVMYYFRNSDWQDIWEHIGSDLFQRAKSNFLHDELIDAENAVKENPSVSTIKVRIYTNSFFFLR